MHETRVISKSTQFPKTTPSATPFLHHASVASHIMVHSVYMQVEFICKCDDNMSSVAFWNARKKAKRNPRVEFQLKDPKTLVLTLKHIYGDTPFKTYPNVGVRQYEIPVKDLQRVVNVCDANAWEVVPFPDQVQEALDFHFHATFDKSFHETSLWKSMFPYQREGVTSIVENFNGRALVGDEMGLGKTLQAISTFKYYAHTTKKAGRLLVICPAYLRFNWHNELNKWVPGIESTVILTGKDSLEQTTPLIISYELAAARAKDLKQMKFDMVICDESHYLKSHKTKRTKALTPLVKSIKRALLLSGTPALNRPCEVYAQMHMLCPRIFPKFKLYADRYCNGHMSPMGFYDSSGMSNNFELKWIVRKMGLIRRVKRDVLTQLPQKNRSEIYVQLEKKEIKPMTPLFEKWSHLNKTIPTMVPASDAIKAAAFERKCLISELFRKTSVAKINVVKKVVSEMVEQGLKFIVFCYHKALMDAVQEVCPSHIRIDGNTPIKNRQGMVDAFQEGDVQVAVLSLLAASTGLTLTATSIVLMAEMFFVPGVILQAEDRVHRIGQKNACDIRYIIAKGSLDEHIWKMLHYKLATLDTALDGRSDRSMKGKKIEWNGLEEM